MHVRKRKNKRPTGSQPGHAAQTPFRRQTARRRGRGQWTWQQKTWSVCSFQIGRMPQLPPHLAHDIFFCVSLAAEDTSNRCCHSVSTMLRFSRWSRPNARRNKVGSSRNATAANRPGFARGVVLSRCGEAKGLNKVVVCRTTACMPQLHAHRLQSLCCVPQRPPARGYCATTWCAGRAAEVRLVEGRCWRLGPRMSRSSEGMHPASGPSGVGRSCPCPTTS